MADVLVLLACGHVVHAPRCLGMLCPQCQTMETIEILIPGEDLAGV